MSPSHPRATLNFARQCRRRRSTDPTGGRSSGSLVQQSVVSSHTLLWSAVSHGSLKILSGREGCSPREMAMMTLWSLRFS